VELGGTAYWAWHPDRKEHEAGYTLFRRDVTCADKAPYHIIVSADNRFNFYLDGKLLGRGPLRGDLDHYFYDEYEGVLAAGRHVFAAEVVVWSEAWQWSAAPWAELLLGVEDVPFATFKIGAAAPPIETKEGFLLFFHAVDNDPAREIVYPNGARWCSRYTCGAVLLDKKDPFEILAMTRKPLLVPETDYETGNMELFWRENVIFPCGAVMEKDVIRLYYGAGDYSTCMAEIDPDELRGEMTPYTRKTREATVSPTELWNGCYGWEEKA